MTGISKWYRSCKYNTKIIYVAHNLTRMCYRNRSITVILTCSQLGSIHTVPEQHKIFQLCNPSSVSTNGAWHRCSVTAVLPSLLEKAFWMPNLSTLEGQTDKCRYNAEENSVLLQRRQRSQVLARHTLQVYHFKRSKPVYMWTHF